VYRIGSDHREYLPDFVAETVETIYMLETKAVNEAEDVEVLSKKSAAKAWCQRASDYTAIAGGKAWRYLLIPHTAVTENRTLESLANEFANR
ncbi:MAG: type III restriction endonuclease subunit R, partial [Ktedonobacteraceae bacterium]